MLFVFYANYKYYAVALWLTRKYGLIVKPLYHFGIFGKHKQTGYMWNEEKINFWLRGCQNEKPLSFCRVILSIAKDLKSIS